MQNPWKGAVHWLASQDLFSVLSYRTEDHQPRDVTTHGELGTLPLITNHVKALVLNLIEQLPQLRPLPPSGCYQLSKMRGLARFLIP